MRWFSLNMGGKVRCSALERSLMTKFDYKGLDSLDCRSLFEIIAKLCSLNNYFHTITHCFVSWTSNPWEKLSNSSKKAHSESTNTKYKLWPLLHTWHLSFGIIKNYNYGSWPIHDCILWAIINFYVQYPHACVTHKAMLYGIWGRFRNGMQF